MIQNRKKVWEVLDFVPMYIETVPNRSSRPAILLREGWREGARVRKKTLANLTDWPAEKVDSLRRVLKGQRLVSPEAAFTIERSAPHGHVELLLAMVRRLGLDRLIAPKRSPERDRVVAMVVRDRGGSTGAEEGVEDEVAGVGGDLENTLNEGFGLGGFE